jgi:hypothetical protein
MKFIHRLKYFLLGFGIGLIFVFFFFKDRGWDWLPGNRVTKFILTNPMEIDENFLLLLHQNNIKTDLLFDVIENGSVLFSESETKERIKNYKLELDTFKLTILVSFEDSSSTIINLNNLKDKQSQKVVSIPFYPSDSLFFSKILKKEIKANDLFLCQLKKEELNYDSIITHLYNNKLLREFSRPYKKPNPIYYSIMNFQEKKILIYMEEGSKKIRLKAMSVLIESNPQISKKETLIEELHKAKCNKI